MRFRHCLLFLLSMLCIVSFSHAQPDSGKPVKVAVFIPLYVDDVFDGNTLSNPALPKTLLPGLEFYNGVMMAIDSLNAEGAKVEIDIYDTKDSSRSLQQVLKSAEMNDVGLIIAAITNVFELKTFSEEGLRRNIPVISATYPNYGGIVENPFFVVLNSSFQAHIEGIYKYMQKNFASGTITAITKQGGSENFVKSFISQLNKSTHSTPVKFKWLNVSEQWVSINHLLPGLDSTKENVVFVASPIETFGAKIFNILCSSPSYKTTLIGMPTWDGIKDIDNKACSTVEVVYSTPFLFYSQNKQLASLVNQRYKDKYFSRPSDMAFKGFETTYHFTKLLMKHRDNLATNLSDKSFTLFNQFDLKPLKVKKTSTKPDIIENRKLYFIKKQAGVVKSVS